MPFKMAWKMGIWLSNWCPQNCFSSLLCFFFLTSHLNLTASNAAIKSIMSFSSCSSNSIVSFFLLILVKATELAPKWQQHTHNEKPGEKGSRQAWVNSLEGWGKILNLSPVYFQGLILQFWVINLDVENRCDSDRLGLAWVWLQLISLSTHEII